MNRQGALRLSRLEIKLLAVPGAGHDRALTHPIRERSSTVAAGVVNGVKFPINVEQSNLLALHLHTKGGAEFQLAGGGHLGQYSHDFLPFPVDATAIIL